MQESGNDVARRETEDIQANMRHIGLHTFVKTQTISRCEHPLQQQFVLIATILQCHRGKPRNQPTPVGEKLFGQGSEHSVNMFHTTACKMK